MQETSTRGIGPSLERAATAMDEQGRRVRRSPESRTSRRLSGYVSEAIVDGALFWLVGSSLVWSLPFLTDAFVAPQAVMQLSLLASMIANLAFVIYDEGWFRHSIKVGLCALAFAATYSLLTVFPFAFDNAGIDVIVRISLMVGLIGIGIAAVVEFFQLLFGWIKS